MKYKAFLFFLTIVLTFIFLKDVKQGSFLFLHDEDLFLSKNESLSAFYVQNPLDLGSPNSSIMLATFWSRLFYTFVYSVGLNLNQAQVVIYFLKILIALFLPYIGFKKLSTLYLKDSNDLISLVVSLWYSFNTYAVIYWHGNSFSLPLLLCYALAPLSLYYLHLAILEKSDTRIKAKAALLLFLMSFGFYLFAVYLLVITFYIVVYILAYKKNVKSVIANTFILGILSLPLFSLFFVSLYNTFVNGAVTVNTTGGETFGALRGSLLYPLFMWFSWGIYTVWEPRNIFTFYRYYYTLPSLLSPFVIYFLIIYGVMKGKKNLLIYLFLILFLLMVFVIKGSQPPYGNVFLHLIDNFPLFRIFRSPDNKFGFGIVFTLSILLLLVSRKFRKPLFVILISLVVLIQGFPLFSGVAIKGENTTTSTDRIISVPSEYKSLIEFLNSSTDPYGYVLVFPPQEFGFFNLGENEGHVGQDLLPKYSELPFIYLSEYSSMLSDTYTILRNSISRNDLTILDRFPVKYIVIRNDTGSLRPPKELIDAIENTFNKVYENKLFKVYENSNMTSLVEGAGVRFSMINPIKYEITLLNIRGDKKVVFNQNYNYGWTLYPRAISAVEECSKSFEFADGGVECVATKYPIIPTDISYLFQPPVFQDKHEKGNGYANIWTFNADEIKNVLEPWQYRLNSDGSMDIGLTLYFRPQALFYFSVLLNFLYLLGVLVFISWKNIHAKK